MLSQEWLNANMKVTNEKHGIIHEEVLITLSFN